MEFIDLHKQQQRIKDNLDKRIARVLKHGQYIMGPEVKELEDKLCKFTSAKHCITSASGTVALDLIMNALNIGPLDAVLTTPFSFIATAETIARTGAVPVFVDIDPLTFNLDPKKLEETLYSFSSKSLPEPIKNSKPRAILTADIFGNPLDYDSIFSIAKKADIPVLEDGAQGFGSTYNEKALCNVGCLAAATSFFPTKPLGCYGDGGAVFTNDSELAETIDSLRYHGRKDAKSKNDNVRLGCNGRLDTLQAAIILAKLEIFEEEIYLRQKAANKYTQLLKENMPDIRTPVVTQGATSNWAQYTIMLPAGANRQKVIDKMKKNGIPLAVYYPKCLHIQKCMAYLGYAENDFPNAVNASKYALSLPMHPYLTDDEQEKTVACLAKACAVI